LTSAERIAHNPNAVGAYRADGRFVMDLEPTVISFDGVRKFYGSDRTAGGATLALDSFNLQIRRSEILSIIGPTGCGKSTAMNLLAGFETPSSGRVVVDGQTVTGPGPNRAVVFQQAALFPWLSVLDNVTLSLQCRGVPRSTYEPRAREMLAEVGLAGFERHYPYQLSGGMQQRVQIARALIVEPHVLLMDEPFGALDYQTRLLMQKLLLRLWEHFRPTILFITHDVGEAIFVSDRVVVLSRRPGRVKLAVDVPAPKPRDYEFLSTPEFVALERDLLVAVQSEVEDREAVPS
jgi:NitT/TauT family transport system ATP-binding protein